MKTQADRTREYYKRQKERGLTQIKIWVPDDEEVKAEIRKYVKKKHKEYNKIWGVPD